jgi:hypothetical protein
MPSPQWIRSPAHLAERFAAALPDHPDIVRKPMFGYPAAFANGNLIQDPAALAAWLRRALAFTLTLPKKTAKHAGKKRIARNPKTR